MKVCIIDTETTGLDTANDWVIEIAGILYDEDWEPIEGGSSLINRPEVYPLKMTEIHGITEEMLQEQGLSAHEAFTSFLEIANKADYLMAHNANYDSSIIASNLARTPGVELGSYLEKQWLCSKNDVSTHFGKRCTKLSHLAVDYGLTVDGSTLHRALDDVILTGKMMQKTGLKASEIVAWKQEPWAVFQALVEAPWKDGGKSTALAKADGYTWQTTIATGDRVFEKKWVKPLKRSKVEEERAKTVGFKRLILEGV